MITIRQERAADVDAREALLDAAYPARIHKPSERLRAGRKPARGLALVAVEDGRVIGTVRLWDVTAGPNHAALLLGPLAVDPALHRRGIGAALMQRALAAASRRGHARRAAGRRRALLRPVRLFGRADRGLWLPGLAERHRLLAKELKLGALDGVRGAIRVPAKPARAPLVAAIAGLAAPKAA